MTDRSKILLVAAAVALAGVATAPAFAVAMSGQFSSAKIAVMAPASADTLGTIWFEVADDAKTSGVSFGGPR